MGQSGLYRNAMSSIRVLVADDSALMRQTLKRIICEEPGMELAGTARDGEDAVAKARELPVSHPEEVPIAIIESGKVRYGLIADRFVSEVEVLVKPLAGGLEKCNAFHGAAILGDGRVVLVLNPLECHRLNAVGSR